MLLDGSTLPAVKLAHSFRVLKAKSKRGASKETVLSDEQSGEQKQGDEMEHRQKASAEHSQKAAGLLLEKLLHLCDDRHITKVWVAGRLVKGEYGGR